MDSINSNFIIKSKYQQKLNDNICQCLTCERKCQIQNGKSGFCQTRLNENCEIKSIVYGCIPALSNNPIEKKPLFHFFPGTMALTLGTYGCNFNCFWCQNSHISHPEEMIISMIQQEKNFLSPQNLIELAKKKKCKGTSISFNEPTLLFEYSLEVFALAKKEGLYNTYVSNGYMTEIVLRDLAESGLDAINIDIKGDSEMVKKYCGTDVEKVWRNAKLAKKLGIHVEITTLMIQKLNSNEEIIKQIAQRILNDLGEYTPFHISRFFPHYQANKYGYFLPTPLNQLYRAHEIAKNVGLKFVYLGNLTDSSFENTVCPKCLNMVIERTGFTVRKLLLDPKGNCKFCGYPICRV
jgi:pyruvate formate lyase activating enzyme